MTRTRRAGAAATTAAIMAAAALLPALARAQPAMSAPDAKAAAEVLFESGKRLMSEKSYAEACPKFAESLRLERGIGTMLWLADCWQKSGRTASAWAQFREADAIASAAGDARAEVARARADALAPNLPKLRLDVAMQSTPAAITRDGVDIGAAQWGVEVPVDPGGHDIVARAPGRREFRAHVEVSVEPKVTAVAVPPLAENTPAASALEPENVRTPTPMGAQRLIGLGVLGLGVVGVAAGTFFALHARSRYDDSSANCAPDNRCGTAGIAARSDASKSATASTIAFLAGGVAVTAGVVLILTGARDSGGARRSRSARGGRFVLVPVASPRTGGGAASLDF